MLKLTGITKRFGKTVAVDGLTLELRPGEIFGLLGPNGAGKTTTFKIAVGLLRADSGQVEVCGYDLHREPQKAKACIGFVAEEPLLYEKLTGWEFLELVCYLWSVPRREGERRARRLLELLELDAASGQLIDTYSLGMRQKLALAGALIHNPRILIVDEPTEGLDPPSARLVRDLLRALADQGVTVFMATHILEVAERFCDRVGIIDQGKSLAVGSVEELLRERREENLEELFLRLVKKRERGELLAYLDEGARGPDLHS